MLTVEQKAFFEEHGYLHIPNVFDTALLSQMRTDFDWMIQQWAEKGIGWTGPWRQKYMDDETEKKSKLIAMHDLSFYAQSWTQAVTHPKLCEAMGQLLDGCVELHHSTMHVKPSQTGHPFPMHQDWAFYKHMDGRYVDVLVHLDDTCHENGEIRFIDGSHKQGALEHITQSNGQPCTPHLPTDQYRLEDSVAVPAKAGDVVCFNIHTIHGSYINQTPHMRRMARVGYRHPLNRQYEGQSCGRPGLMVAGQRPRGEGDERFSIAGPTSENKSSHGIVMTSQK